MFDVGTGHLEPRAPGRSEQRDGEAAVRGAERLYGPLVRDVVADRKRSDPL